MVDNKTLALVFAGQGSQSIGMMAGFADLPVVEETLKEASDILNVDILGMLTSGPDTALAQTVNTQPVMLAAGVATFRAWTALGGPAAACYAGHSLGEYSALVAAGALKFEDALPLVRFRAESMQAAVPEGTGGIAAVLGLDEAAVQSVCADAAQTEVLEAVNLNSPGQTVIAGHRTAVERGMALAKERGAKRALMLPMSVPSHCALMKPAADKLEAYLRNVPFATPRVPVIQNADVQAFATPEDIKAALVRQLYRPVRWIETVQALAGRGATVVAECVPGKVLTGLNKRIVSDAQCVALADSAAMRALIEGAQ
ncbi:MAG: ACP S-malonyltransferase [Betaproteobacteria bacterium]|nr:ACP S-malonyltransferase [Betaproteobacteria bacterium]